MLTRVEISGFKTFDGFALDVPPFLAVIGPNASGKSNLFDALQFLRRLTESSLSAAVQDARGDIDDLFRRRGDGSSVDHITMAIEVLLHPSVKDSWGTEVSLTQTRLRYEIDIEQRRDSDGNVRLFVVDEAAYPLKKSEDRWRRDSNLSGAFEDSFVKDGRRRTAFLEAVPGPKGRVFATRQDGVQGRARPAEAAEATVLSSMTSAEFRHLYALREEIIGWRFLQFDPMSLRLPGEKYGESRLEPSGSNLARVLHRIKAETATEDTPEGALADISTDLASLIDNVRSVEVRENPQTTKWEIVIRSMEEGEYSSSVASDGTLRILALLASLYDPTYQGLVCFEEPENGVHPLRLRLLIRYLRDLATRVDSDDVTVEDGLVQVIVNSHSPVVLSTLDATEAAVLDSAVLVEDGSLGRVRSRVSRVRRISRRRDEALPIEELRGLVTPAEVRRFEAAALLEDAP